MNAMGHKTPRKWEEEPLLALLWEEYLASRAQQYVTFRKPDGANKDKERIVTFLYPTHIATWPYGGGVRDQPYLIVKIFAAFLSGEQQGVLRSIR